MTPLRAVVLCLYALGLIASASCADTTIRNRNMMLTFASDTLALKSIISLMQSPPYEYLAAPVADWWTATIVTATSSFAISTSSPCSSTYAVVVSPTHLSLVSDGIVLNPPSLGTVNVAVEVYTREPLHTVEMYGAITAVNTTEPIGHWDWIWQIPVIAASSDHSHPASHDDVLIIPDSYGQLWSRPLQNAPWRIDETYPSAGGTYQFLAHYHDSNTSSFPPAFPGLYVGAHDPSAALKTFTYIPDVVTDTLTLAVTFIPPNGNLPLPQRAIQYPFVLGVFRGDWWDAAQVYRNEFALTAPWTQRRIAERDDYPDWFLSTQVWINSGWQGVDIFNDTQGDPVVVVERVSLINKRFALPFNSIALHWYVFQEANRFDANYPVYFPAKPAFTEAVAVLQQQGVSVAPYVNGRIFDINISKWRDDKAERWAAKWTPPQLGSSLHLYYEDYGNNVTQAAMCPDTDYWQKTYQDVADTLVNTHGVHGIYIDQVGAASAQSCFDPQHNHTFGDGTSWHHGYERFFQRVRKVTGRGTGLVTESNAEPYMNMLNGYLTLTAFSNPVVGHQSLFVPVFPAVYGGYFVGFGAVFTVDDMDVNPDGGFATTLAAQFVHGAQLGWMSLGGTQDPPPMGLYEQLMSPAHDAEVDWLRRLALTRRVLVAYFLHGREMRSPVFLTSHLVPPSAPAAPMSPPPAFLASVWFLPADASPHAVSAASIAVLITNPSSSPASAFNAALILNVAHYGFNASQASDTFSVWAWSWDGQKQQIGVYPGHAVTWNGTVGLRSIVALTVQQQQQQPHWSTELS